MAAMKALITGAGGFVGTHLARHLVEEGDEVIATDRRTGGADILDRAAIAEAVTGPRPDVVYHLAGQADVAASWDDPQGTLRSNAEGTLNVLEAAAAAGVQRVIVVTSAEVYGLVRSDDLPVTENLPLNPGNPYAASKAAAEMVAIQWANAGLDVIRARAFNHLGPGQSERFVAAALAGRMIRARATGEHRIPVGNLDARRDFTDVRDVVRAYRLLAIHASAGEAYNVCSGVDRSVRELVDLFIAGMDWPIELIPDPDLQRPSDLPVLRGDAEKLRSATGWQPTIPLEQTVADILDSVSAPPPTVSSTP